eukprot:5034820-Prymnesium_polylepis.1
MSRTEEVKDKSDKKNKYMAKQACEAYPDVLPKVKDAKGHISKPKVTLENVRELLDAIHIRHGKCAGKTKDELDTGHTVEDVETFCKLWGLDMIVSI